MSKKVRAKRLLALSAAVAGMTLFNHSAHALNTLTWGVATDGGGNWDAGVTADWNGGSTWIPANVAGFGRGGTAGTITVSNVTAAGITFGSLPSTGYTLTSGTINLSNSSTLTNLNANSATTINSDLAAGTGAVFLGPGTTVLGGTNTFSGAVTVGGAGTFGNLVLTNTFALGTNALTIDGNGSVNPSTVSLWSDTSTTYQFTVGGVAGSGLIKVDNAQGGGGGDTTSGNTITINSLTDSAVSTLTFANGDNYNLNIGTVTVGANTPVLNNNLSGATLTLGTVNVSTHGTALGGSGVTVINNYTGSGTLAYSGTGMLNLAGSNTYTGATSISGGTVTLSAGGAFSGTTATLTGGLLTSGVTNALSGAAGLTLNAAAAIATLSASNNFTGATLLSNGILNLLDANAISASALTLAGGTLNLHSDASTGSVITYATGGGTINQTTATTALINVDHNTGANTGGTFSIGAYNMGTNSIESLTLTNADSYNLIISNLVVTGSDTNTLTNNFAGATVTLNTLTATSSTANTLSLIMNGSGTTSIGTVTLGGTDQNYTMTQIGTGATILTSSNVFTGAARVAAGQLILNAAGALNIGANGISVTGGNLQDNVANGITGATPLTINGATATATLVSSNTFSGGVTLTNGQLNLLDINAISASALTLTAGTLNLNSDAATGSVITYNSGAISVTTGHSVTINVNQNTSGKTGGTISLGTTLTENADTLALTNGNNYSFIIPTLSLGASGAISNTFTNGTVTINSLTDSAASTLTLLGQGTTSINTIGVGTGVLGITQTGPGTTILAGTTGFTGVTTVSGGQLVIAHGAAINSGNSIVISSSTATLTENSGLTNGITGATAITISAGTAVLASTNNYTGATSISGGTLSLTVGGAISSSTITSTGGLLITTVSNALSGNTVLNINGAGAVVTLGSSNNYTGATTLTNGIFNLLDGNAISASALTLTGGTLNLNSDAATGSVITYNSGAISVTTGHSVTINVNHNTSSNTGGTISLANSFTEAADTLNLTNGNNYNFIIPTLTVSGAVSALSNTFSNGTVTIGTLTNSAAAVVTSLNGTGVTNINAIIQNATAGDTLSITQAGGATNFNGTSNYTGVTTVTGGTLALNSVKAINGSSSITISGASTVVSLTVAGAINNTPITLASGTFGETSGLVNGIQGSGALTVTGGTATLGSSNNFTGAVSLGAGVLTLVDPNAIASNSGFSHTAGTLSLQNDNISSVNTYAGFGASAGQTAITQTTVINVDNISGSAGITGGTMSIAAYTEQGGGIVKFTNAHAYNLNIGTLTMTWSAAGGVTPILSNTFSNGILAINDLLFNYGGGSGTFGELINGAGTTTINTLSFAPTANNGKTMNLTLGVTGMVVESGPMVVVAANTLNMFLNAGGTLSLQGAFDLSNANVTVSSNSVINEATITNSISGTTALTLTSGQINLGESNTYTGATTLTGGTLSLSVAGAITGSAFTVNGPGVFVETANNALTGATAITLGNSVGVAVTLADSNNYTGATQITGGTLTLNAPGAVTGSTITVSNQVGVNGGAIVENNADAITGASGVVLNTVSDSVTLGQSNNYTGVTSISNGTLYLGAAGAISAGTITVTGGSLAETAAGGLSGGANLVLNATGVSVGLGQSNNYTGFTSVTLGTLALTAGGAITGSTITASGGVITTSAANALSGATALNITGGAVTLSAADNYTGATTLTTGSLNLNAANAITGGTITVNGAGVLTNSVVNGIGGAAGLTVNAAAANVTLGVSNNFTGATTLTSGILNLTDPNAIASTSGLNLNGGTLNLHTDASTASVITYGTGPITMITGISATINVDHFTSGNTGGTLALGNSITELADTLAVSNADGYSLIIPTLSVGASSAALSNSFTNGTLTINLFTNTVATTYTFLGGGTTNIGTVSQSSGNPITFNYSGTGVVNITGSNNSTGGTTLNSGTLTMGPGASYTNGTVTVSSGWFDATAANNLSGAAGLTVSGNTATATLASSNNYTGATLLTNGQIFLLDPNAIESTSGLTLNGGTLFLHSDNATSSVISYASGPISMATGHSVTLNVDHIISANTGATISLANTFTELADTVSVTNGDSFNLILPTLIVGGATGAFSNGMTGATATINNITNTVASTYTFLGAGTTSVGTISQSSGNALGIVQAGSGGLIITGSDNATGGTSVTLGTLFNGVGNALATGSTIAVQGSGIWNLNGYNQTLAGISSTGNGNVTNSIGSTTSTLTINTATATTGATSNFFTGNLAIVKTGNGGTLTIGGGASDTNAATYTGGLYVLGGDVALNKASGTSAVGANSLIQVGDGAGGSLATLSFNQIGQTQGTDTLTINNNGIINLGFQVSETLAALNMTGGTISTGNWGNTLSILGNLNLTAFGNTSASTAAQLTAGNITGDMVFTNSTIHTLTIASHAAGGATVDANLAFTVTGTGITLYQNGGGDLELGVASNYTGTYQIANGYLRLGAAAALATGVNTLTLGDSSLNTSGTLDLGGFSPAAFNNVLVAGSGTQVITNASATAATFIYTPTATVNMSGINFGGTLSVTFGGGTTTLGSTSTYNGATTLAGSGTVLKLANAEALPGTTTLALPVNDTLDLAGFNQTITLLSAGGGQITSSTGNGTLTINNAGNTGAGSNTFGGGLTINKTGTAVFTIGAGAGDTQADTFTGGIIVTGSGSQVQLNKNAGTNAAGSGSISIGDSGTNIATLYLGAANQTTSNNAVIVNNDGVFNTNGNQDTIGSLTVSNSATVDSSANTLTLGGSVTAQGSGSTFSLIQTGVVNLGAGIRTFTVNNGGSSLDLNVTSVLTGAGDTLYKGGAGILKLASAETYIGNTTIDQGKVLIGATNAIPAGATLTLGLGDASSNFAATLDLNGFAQSVTNLTAFGSGASIITDSGGAQTFQFGSTNLGNITFTGALSLNDIGGTSTLTSGSNYNGSTTLTNAGTVLRLGGANALTSGTTILVNLGTTLDLAGNNQTVGVISAGGGNFTNSSGTAATLTVTGAANSANTSNTYSGNLSIFKSGSGTVMSLGSGATDTQVNSLTGSIFVVGGAEIDLNKAAGTSAVGSAAITVGDSGATATTLKLIQANQTSSSNAITITGDGYFNVNGVNDTIGALTMSNSATLASGAGIVTLASSVTGQGSGSTFSLISGKANLGNAGFNTFTINSGGTSVDLNVSAVLSGNGLYKTGAGILELSGVNTYTGNTTLDQGKIFLGVAAALPSGSSQTFTLGDSTLNDVTTLDLNGFSTSISLVATAGTGTQIITDSGGAATLTFMPTSTAANLTGVSFTGTNLSLAFTGGTTTLSSSGNSYGGATTISGSGTVVRLANGQAVTGSGPVVGPGAIYDLAGFNQTWTLLTNGGGQITNSVGTTVATLTFNNTVATGATASDFFTGNMAIAKNSNAAILTLGAGAADTQANTFTGGLMIAGGGEVDLQKAAGTQAAGTGVITIGDGTAVSTLRLLIANQTTSSNAVVINNLGDFNLNSSNVSDTIGSLTMNNSATLATGTGTITLTGPVTDNGGSGASFSIISGKAALAAVTANTFSVASGGSSVDLNVSAIMSGSGNLYKTGAGVLDLTGVNTYTGNTTLDQGKIMVGVANTFLSGASQNFTLGDATTNAVTTLDLNGFALSLSNVATAGTGTQIITDSGAAATLTFDPATVASNLTNVSLTGSSLSVAFAGGSNTLGAVNSYAGVTTLSSGVVTLLNTGSIASSSGLNFTGGTLQLHNDTTTSISTYSIGSFTVAGSTDVINVDHNTSGNTGGTIALSTGIAVNGAFTLSLTNADNYSLNIPTLTIGVNSGTSELVNNFSGATVTIGGLSALTVSNGWNLFFAGSGTTSIGAFNTANKQYGVDQIGTGATILTGANNNINGVNISAGNLVLASTGNLNAAGTVTDNGGTLTENASVPNAIEGNTGITLTAGTVTLGSSNGYTGATALNGGLLNLNAAGAISGSAITITGGTLSESTANAISGTSALTFNNSGNTLTLSVSNNYSGATTVTNGTLQDGSVDGVSTLSALAVAQGATFNLNGFNQTIASVAAGGGVITNSTGNGTLTVTGAGAAASNTYTGNLSLVKTGAGILDLGAGATDTQANSLTNGIFVVGGGEIDLNKAAGTSAAGTASITVGDSTFTGTNTLKLNLANQTTSSNAISITGDGTFNVNAVADTIGALTLSDTASVTGGAGSNLTLGGQVTETGGSGSTFSLISAATVNLGTGTFETFSVAAGGSTLDLNVTSILTGSAGLYKTGGGILRLGASNTYTGNTQLAQGTTILGAVNAISSGSGQTLMLGDSAGDAATLNLNGFAQSVFNLIYVGSGTDSIVDGGGAATTFTIGNIESAANIIFGTGITVNKFGTGTTTTLTTASETSNLLISGGTVADGVNNGVAPSGTVTANSSSVFDLAGFNQSLSAVGTGSTTGGIITNSNGSTVSTLTINNTATTTGGGSMTYTGNLDITKSGTGTLVLGGNSGDNAANTFSKGLFINSGEVDLNKAAGVSSVGTGAVTIGDGVSAAATLKLLSAGGQLGANSNALIINSNGYFNEAGFAESIGSLNMSGGTISIGATSLTLLGNVTATAATATQYANIIAGGTLNLGSSIRTFTVNNTVGAGDTLDLLVTPVIAGTGGIYKNGNGILRLGGANSFTGGAQIAAGILQLGNPAALNTGLSTVTLGDATLNSIGTLDLNGNTATYTNLVVAGTATQTVTDSGTAATFTYAPTATINVNKINFTGSNLSLAFTSGTTTLSTTGNTYGGNTTLSGSATGLVLGVANALSTTTSLTLAATDTLNLNGNNQTINSLLSTFAGNITNSGSLATLTLNNGSAGGNLSSGQISGNLTIVQAGGVVSVNGTAGSYTGDYYLNSGILFVSPGAGTGLGLGTLHLGNAAVEENCCASINITNALSFDGNTTLTGGTGQGWFWTGTTATLTGSRTIIDTINNYSEGVQVTGFNNNITDNGNGYGFTIAGGGGVIFAPTVSNSFSGPVTIVNGAALWRGSNSLGSTTSLAGGGYQTITLGGTGTNTVSNVSLIGYSGGNENFSGSTNFLNNAVNILAGSGTATIGSSDSGNSNGRNTATYTGNITFARNLVIFAGNSGNNGSEAVFTGSIAEAVANSGMSITKNGGDIALINKVGDTTGPSFTGGTFINAGVLSWDYNTTVNDINKNIQFGQTPTGGIPTITLNGGSFEFAVNNGGGLLSGTNVENLDNAIVVTSAGGGLFGASTTASQFASFTGPISLGGTLSVGTRAGTSNTSTNFINYTSSSTITLQNVADGVGRGIVESVGNAVQTQIASPIVDSAVGGNGGPLAIRAVQTNFTISGTGNTYNDGTVVEAAYNGTAAGLLNVSSASSLGAGNVYISPGARLKVNSSGFMQGTGSVTLASTQGAASVLSLGNGNVLPSAFLAGITDTFGNLTATGNGVISLDANSGLLFNASVATPANSGFVNLGSLFLGGSAVFGGSSLAAGATATVAGSTAATYRLGGGSNPGALSTLTINTANVLAGTSNLIIGMPGSGTDANTKAQNLAGAVLLQDAQSFTGNILINPGSSLEGQAVAGGTPFGTTTNTITLAGGILKLDGNTTTNLKTTLGNVNLEGASSLANQFLAAPGSTINTLTISALNRATVTGTDGGGASYSYGGGVLNVLVGGFGTLGVSSKTFITNFNGTGNTPTVSGSNGGIVAPWVTDATGNYYTYGGSGLAIAGFSLGGTASLTDNGTTQLLSSGISTDNIKMAGNDASAASTNVTVNSINGYNGGSGEAITLGANVTLTVLSGGYGSFNGGSLVGGAGSALQAGATGTGELFFNDNAANSQAINVAIFANNFSKNGIGKVGLGANNVGSLFGTLTIDSGVISISSAANLGSLSTIDMNGGRLLLNNGVSSISQNIVLGPGGGGFDSGSNGNLNTLAGNISGPGDLALNEGSQGYIALTGNNTYSGGTLLVTNQNRGLYVGPTSSIGTGDLMLNGGGSVWFEGNNGTSSTAHVLINTGSLVVFEQSSNAIGSLDGAGSINLGGSSTNGGANDNPVSRNITLTVGGNNASTEFDGPINQNLNSGFTGNLIKTGTGNLTLNGSNTYTGTTTINGGVLSVNGSLQGVVNVASGGAIGGAGILYNNLNVASGGAVAPGNSPGTLYANGATTSLSAGTSLNYDLSFASNTVGQGVNDLLVVNSGAFYLGNTGTLNATMYPSSAGSYTLGTNNTPMTYTLISWTGSLASAAGDLTASPTANITIGNTSLASTSWTINSFIGNSLTVMGTDLHGVVSPLGEKMSLFLTPTSTLGGALDLEVAAFTPSISLSSTSLVLYTRPNVGSGATSSNTYSVSTSLANITTTQDSGLYSLSVAAGDGVDFTPTTGSLEAAPNAGTSTVVALNWDSATGVSSAGARLATITVSDLTNSFDGASNTETVGGGVYNIATATVTSTIANIGLFHTNTSKSASLTITNTALGDPNYQDQLSVGNLGIGSSVTVAGSGLGLITAGNSGVLTYTVNTSAAGTLSILNTLSLLSSPTVSPLSSVNLGSLVIATTGTGYDYASPSLSLTSIAFGNLRTGTVASRSLSVSNTVISNAAYQDSLSVGLTGTGNANVATTTSSPFIVTAGTGSLVSFTASLAQAGSLAGNESLSLVSTNSLFGAGGSLSLGTSVVNITGAVYDFAQANLSTTSFNFGALRTGSIGAATLTVSNTVYSNAAFQDSLSVNVVGSSGGLGASTSGFNATAGSAGTVTVTTSVASAGSLNGSTTLGLVSTNSLFSPGTTSLGNATVSITGAVYDYAQANLSTTSFNFGNVHVGTGSVGASLTVSNTVYTNASFQDSLSVNVLGGSNPSLGAVTSGFNATAGSAGTVTVTASLGTAGSVTGTETLGLVSTNSLFSPGTTSLGTAVVSVSGSVYDYANPNLSTSAINFGNLRTGSIATQSLTVNNTVVTNAAYQDSLSVGLTGTGNANVGTSTSTPFIVTAGAGQVVNLTASLAQAGSLAGNESLTLGSTNSIIGGSTNLGTSVVGITGAVYDYAQANISTTAFNFGNVHAGGGTATSSLTVSNTVYTNAAYQDSLSVAVLGGSNPSLGAVTSGFNATAGSAGTVTITASLNTAGSVTGTETLGLISTNSLFSPGTTSLGNATVSVTGAVYDYAQANLSTTAFNFGNVHAGGGTATASLTVSNTVYTNAAYQDSLSVAVLGGSNPSLGAVTSGFNATAGTAGTVTITASLNTAGSVTGTETLGLVSTNSLFSPGTTSLGNATVSVTGAVYDYAQANFSTTAVNFGNIHVGGVGTANLAVSNTVVTNAAYQDSLSVNVLGSSGAIGVTTSGFNATAGAVGTVTISGSVATGGSLSGTTTLGLISTNSLFSPGTSSLGTQVVNVTGAAYNYATASVASTVTVADAFVSSSPTGSNVSVANISPSSYSDALDAYGHATSGLTAGSVTLISGGTTSSLSAAADTSFSHTGGGSITVGLISNGTAAGLGLTTLTPTTVAVTGGNVYDHAALINPAVTIRLTQGSTGSATYSVSNPLGTSSLRDAALVSNVTGSSANFTTNATGLTTFSIAANGSTVYSASYSSTSSSDPTAGNLAFQYGDLHNTLAGANNNNQTLSVAVNAIVDPIVEVNTVSNSGTLTIANTNTASDRVAAGDATTGFIGTVMPQYRAPGQYIPGVLTEANMYQATGHSEGVVDVSVLPNSSGATSALEPVTLLLFDFFNGATETAQQSTDFSALTADLAAFGYTYSTDTTAGVLGQFDHGSIYTPVGYTYELAVSLDSGPTLGENPSQIDFNFSKYGLQVDNLLAVPEPTTVGLLGAAGAGLLARRRRKNKPRQA